MPVLGKFSKQPQEILDYLFDFTPWLEDRGNDTISAFTVTTEAGLTLSGKTESSGVVRFFASGGTVGTTYKVTCVITTVGGRTKEAELNIRIKEI